LVPPECDGAIAPVKLETWIFGDCAIDDRGYLIHRFEQVLIPAADHQRVRVDATMPA
jgi:hypothetical protein